MSHGDELCLSHAHPGDIIAAGSPLSVVFSYDPPRFSRLRDPIAEDIGDTGRSGMARYNKPITGQNSSL
jgi:hypothetical protein